MTRRNPSSGSGVLQAGATRVKGPQRGMSLVKRRDRGQMVVVSVQRAWGLKKKSKRRAGRHAVGIPGHGEFKI